MGRRFLLIDGHPDANRLSAHLLDLYQQALPAGTALDRIAIRDLDFDANLSRGYHDIPPLEPNSLEALPLIALKLRFSPAAAFRVYDEFDRAMVERQPDGSMLVSARLPKDGWVMSYLHSFGTEVEILEPLSLRAEVAAYARAIWQHHTI